jgi:hypothetical protein
VWDGREGEIRGWFRVMSRVAKCRTLSVHSDDDRMDWRRFERSQRTQLRCVEVDGSVHNVNRIHPA